MTNIPTDLVRTFVAVVDLRSFTKAAAKLGVTQPAVSAQIKRLQSLLGGDLFDRSVQGQSDAAGRLVVSYARAALDQRSDRAYRDTPRARAGDPRRYAEESFRESGARAIYEELADAIAVVLYDSPDDPAARKASSAA